MNPEKKLTLKQTCLIIGGYLILITMLVYGVYYYFQYQNEPAFKLISDYKKVLKQDPNNSEAYARLGDLYFEMAETYPEKNYLEDAKEVYEKAVQLYPEHVGYRYNLALVYEMLGKKELNEKQLIEVIKIEPQNVLANFDLAIIYKKEKKLQKAIEHFENCLKIEPSAANVYYELGEIYEELNNKNKAISMYIMVQKYNPNYLDIQDKMNELK